MSGPSTSLPPGSGWFKCRWAAAAVGGLLLGRCGLIQTDDPSPNPRIASTATIPCQDTLADVNESVRLGLLEAEWFAESLLVGDVSGAKAHYDNTMFLGELTLIQVDTFLGRCESYARAESIYTDLQQASANLQSELDQVRRTCRQELAPFGFDC